MNNFSCLKRSLAISLLLLPLYGADADPETPRRIISMAPSTTEILFALGLGDRVAGVSRFCDYPEAVPAIREIGGYMDPDYEAIVRLQPDLVILLVSHQDAKKELAKLAVPVLTVPQETIAGIHEAIRRIGDACGAAEKAETLLRDLRERTEKIKSAVHEKKKPRVLLCIGRDTQSGRMASMFMAGRKTFYDEIIRIAGGINALSDAMALYPQFSAEGVIQVNPDVIIDLAGRVAPGGKSAADIAAQWDRLHVLKAVKQDQVHVITGDHALRPGPRYIRLLEELAPILHPEAFNKEPAKP
jgi:iron complex transport system substrate-binding protein